MTERLYYHDARLLQFDARVSELRAGGTHVVLDRTAFYPTSGGQPHDTGTLGGRRVVDVVDEDEEIIHVLDAPLDATRDATVHGDVEWSRRFDHMQQHTGQHLLSALLADRLDAPTASVHFGTAYSTVDVSVPSPIPDARLAEIEAEANDIIATNRTVRITFEDAASATGLRKPSDRSGVIRIITIDGVDRSACGGTHVAQLSEIGPIVLRRIERMKGQQRIEFLCGRRAIAASRADYTTLQQLSRALSAAPSELPALLEGQVAHIKELEREQRRLQDDLARFRATELWSAHPVGNDGLRRIHLVVSGQARDYQQVAAAIARLGHALVVVTGSSTNSVLIATSEDSGIDAGATMKALMEQHGGRGGGSPRLAQGSAPTAEPLALIVDTLQCTPPG
jgi:alanyl-tRNA synthetase